MSYCAYTMDNVPTQARWALESAAELCERGRQAVDGPPMAWFMLGDQRVNYTSIVGEGRTVADAVNAFAEGWAEYADGKDGYMLWWRKRPSLHITGLEDQEVPVELVEDELGEVPDELRWDVKCLSPHGLGFAVRARLALTETRRLPAQNRATQ